MTEYRECEKGNLQAVVSMFHYSNRSEFEESFLYFQKTDVDRVRKVHYLPLV